MAAQVPVRPSTDFLSLSSSALISILGLLSIYTKAPDGSLLASDAPGSPFL
jgi:hypothetical protein